MQINKIRPYTNNYNNSKNYTPNFTSKKDDEELQKVLDKLPKLSPVQLGIGDALLWFGIGLGTDRLLGKMFKFFKTPMKTALITNGILGTAMGIYTYFKAKNAQKK